MTACMFEDYAKSLKDPSSLYCLSRGDATGLTVTAVAGIVSLNAILYMFMLISGNLYWSWKTTKRIFHYPMEVLVFALFIAHILQAIGGALNFRWINIGKVEVGGFCNIQGIIQTVGDTGVAFGNILIASFTFFGIGTSSQLSMRAANLSAGVSCIFSILIVISGNTLNSQFMAPTPYQCWISKEYVTWQLFSEYLWLWIALFWVILTHLLLFLLLRGHILPMDRWWHFHFRTRPDREYRVPRYLVRNLLWFPVNFCIIVLPLSVIRWIGFMQENRYGTTHTPAAAIFASNTIFILGGFFNTIILRSTRPNLFGLEFPSRVPEMGTLSLNVSEVERRPNLSREDLSIGRLPS